MRVLPFLVMLLMAASCLPVRAQQGAPEPTKTQSEKAETKAADNGADAAQENGSAAESTKTQSPAVESKPAAEGPAVDAAKVTGSTFESDYFKFTYELPKGWKALDDAVRVASNQAVLAADSDRAAAMTTPLPKKASTRPQTAKKGPGPASSRAPLPARYSLMAASSNAIESLASPVLPRINIWAHERVGSLDNPADHAQFLVANKRTQVLEPIHEVTLDGHTFVRVDVLSPTGEYVSEFVSTMRDYLVGFDFRAQSQRELVEMTETMKSLKFQ